jgi:hypothetical protein
MVAPLVTDDKTQFSVRWHHGDIYPVVGIVAFAGERLTFINKSWDPDESSGYNLAKAIFFAAKSLNEQGCGSMMRLTTELTDQRGFQTRRVVLHCEGTNRRFDITSVDAGPEVLGTGKQSSATLSEILQVVK